MLLLNEDVKRISRLGYKEDFFILTNSEGFKMLKNSSEGRCVFHDGTKCTIYGDRPKGCKLYPIVFNEDSMAAVKDAFCPFRDEFRISQKAKKELSNMYPRLLSESSHRIQARESHTGHLRDY
jgi:uncharacterized protein